MIDNYEQATALVERMAASVPIPARSTRQMVEFLPKHPLAGEIRTYQETRTRRLARSGGRPSVITIDRCQGDK